jgi:hypothetical protein
VYCTYNPATEKLLANENSRRKIQEKKETGTSEDNRITNPND